MPRVIDLTMSVYEGLPMLSILTPFKITHTSRVDKDGYELTDVVMSGHTGTHIDAPLHFIPGGATIEMTSLESVIGRAAVFNLSHLPNRSPITSRDLDNCGIKVSRGDAAIIYTGSEKWLGKPEYFTEYPYLTKDASEWLIDKGITVVGMDMVSADTVSVEPVTFEAHKTLLGSGVYIVESLVNLERLLESKSSLFIALPLKIVGAEATPVRAVALEF